MYWEKEFHGSKEYGWRTGGWYVGRSPKGWWRVWEKSAGQWSGYEQRFHTVEEAKRFVEGMTS
jgi:hypothetical protein